MDLGGTQVQSAGGLAGSGVGVAADELRATGVVQVAGGGVAGGVGDLGQTALGIPGEGLGGGAAAGSGGELPGGGVPSPVEGVGVGAGDGAGGGDGPQQVRAGPGPRGTVPGCQGVAGPWSGVSAVRAD